MMSISVRGNRFSHDLIAGSGEFVVNLVDEAHCKALDFCGVRSGRDVDKWQECHLAPMPALNMMTITPSSATCDRKSLGWMMFSTAGPITRPATSAPTTWGICSLPVSMLSALVASRIRARSARYP